MSRQQHPPQGYYQPVYRPGIKYSDPTGGKPLGKPLGIDLRTRLNSTYIGPAKRYIHWALFVFGIFVIFITTGSTYLGLRNVSRLIVYRTEFIGPFFILSAIVCVSIMAWLITKARIEGNKWRANIRFRADGLKTVTAYHLTYQPEELNTGLKSGTETAQAIKQLRRPRRGGRSRAGSEASMASVRSTRSARSGRRVPPPGHGYRGAPPPGVYYPPSNMSASSEKIPRTVVSRPDEPPYGGMPYRGPLLHPGMARVMGSEGRMPLYNAEATDSSV